MGPVKEIKQKKESGEGEGVTKSKQRQPKEGRNASRCEFPSKTVVDFSPTAATLHNMSTVEAKAVIARKAATINLLMQQIKDLEKTVTLTLTGSPVTLNKQKTQKFKIKNKKQWAAKKNGNTTWKQFKKKNNKSPVTPKNMGNNKKPSTPKRMGKVANKNVKSEITSNPTPTQKEKKKNKKNKAAVTAKPTGASVVSIQERKSGAASNEGNPKQKKKKWKKNKSAVTTKPTGASVVPSKNKKRGSAANEGTPKQKKTKNENAKPRANNALSGDNKRKASVVIDKTSVFQKLKKMKV